MTDLFDHAFSYDMVRQAAKGLCADDVVDSAVDQFQHFTGEEPAFTGLVSKRNDIFGIVGKVFDVCRRCEMTAGTEFFCSGFAELFHQFDSHVCNGGRRFFHTQFFCLEIAVVEAVKQEVNEIRHNSLCTLGFQKFHQMVVGSRKEFDQDLAYDTYFRFLHIRNGDVIKFPDDLAADLFELTVGRITAGNKFLTDTCPFFVKLVGSTFYLFIRPHPVDTAHKHIAKECSVDAADQKLGRQLKAGVFLQSA